jgi:hypothetical protein
LDLGLQGGGSGKSGEHLLDGGEFLRGTDCNVDGQIVNALFVTRKLCNFRSCPLSGNRLIFVNGLEQFCVIGRSGVDIYGSNGGTITIRFCGGRFLKLDLNW